MQVECRKYTDAQEAEWDAFIEKNKRNATFLHSRKFFKHNPLNSGDDESLMFYKKNKLIGVLPATLYKKGHTIFHSHPRSTYGGFVVEEEVGVEEALEMVEVSISYAKEKQADEIIIRNPFRIFHQMPSDETDYAMWFYGFTLRSREIESVIMLHEKSQDLYADGTKRSVKKALKNLEVRFSDDYPAFWRILTDNLLAKHNVPPVHNIDQFLLLRNLVGHDHIKLVTAELNGEIIGGIILFIVGKSLHAQYIASDIVFQQMRPVNAVIDFIIAWGIQNHFAYFNLGSGNEDGGKKINYGLFNFKEGFGGRGILRETMSLKLNTQ